MRPSFITFVGVLCASLAAFAHAVSQQTAEELRRLKSLLDDGVLSEREYRDAKDAALKKYIGEVERSHAGSHGR